MSTLVDPRELVGVSEAAKVAGMSLAAFKRARDLDRVPTPVAQLACGQLWTRSQIENWAAARAASRRP